MRAVLIVTAVAALAACAPTAPTYRDLDRMGAEYQRQASSPPQTADEATQRDACGAHRFHALIGTPASAIDPATLPPRTRIITPDMMVTQDFSPQRLNILVGSDGKVGSLRCF
jgi:hypothetical protein